MNKKIMVTAVVVVALGVGAYFMLNKKSDDSTKTDTTSTTQTTQPTDTAVTPSAATITYSSNGFSLSASTVKSGDTITVKNTSSSSLQMESDPHPAHTDDTDLNVGPVSPGESKTFKVTKKGTFGFHNHLNSSDKGSITIE